MFAHFCIAVSISFLVLQQPETAHEVSLAFSIYRTWFLAISNNTTSVLRTRVEAVSPLAPSIPSPRQHLPKASAAASALLLASVVSPNLQAFQSCANTACTVINLSSPAAPTTEAAEVAAAAAAAGGTSERRGSGPAAPTRPIASHAATCKRDTGWPMAAATDESADGSASSDSAAHESHPRRFPSEDDEYDADTAASASDSGLAAVARRERMAPTAHAAPWAELTARLLKPTAPGTVHGFLDVYRERIWSTERESET